MSIKLKEHCNPSYKLRIHLQSLVVNGRGGNFTASSAKHQ